VHPVRRATSRAVTDRGGQSADRNPEDDQSRSPRRSCPSRQNRCGPPIARLIRPGRPSLAGDCKSFAYDPGQVGLPNDAAPRILNTSWTLSADIDVAESGVEDMIVTHGGLVGGFGLYVREGRPTFVSNDLELERPTITGGDPRPRDKVKLVIDLKYEGRAGGRGKPATATMSVNGNKDAEGRLERTIPFQISLGEGMDIGMDVGSPVDPTYRLPFAFKHKIDKVTIEPK
jgi:arylsulfatase